MSTNPLRMILPVITPDRKGFYIAFTALDQDQFDRIKALPDPKVVTGPPYLRPEQALPSGPIILGGRMFSVLHIWTAWENK